MLYSAGMSKRTKVLILSLRRALLLVAEALKTYCDRADEDVATTWADTQVCPDDDIWADTQVCPDDDT